MHGQLFAPKLLRTLMKKQIKKKIKSVSKKVSHLITHTFIKFMSYYKVTHIFIDLYQARWRNW